MDRKEKKIIGIVFAVLLLIGFVLVLVVVMYAVSIWFSIRIMEKKEM